MLRIIRVGWGVDDDGGGVDDDGISGDVHEEEDKEYDYDNVVDDDGDDNDILFSMIHLMFVEKMNQKKCCPLSPYS